MAEKLEHAAQGSFTPRLAHYLCEQAATQVAQGQFEAALELLQSAIGKAPEAARARLDLAQLQAQLGQETQAWDTLMQALDSAPATVPLIARPLAELALRSGHVAVTLARLQQLYAEQASLDVLEAIVTLADADPATTSSARDWYAHHLEKEPSLVAATRWIAGEKLEHEQFHPQVQRALDHAIKPLLRYRCAACGFEATQHFWQCPGCQTWDSYPARRVEEL
jgi:lipopolysaccharide biosynthesis regulator YciM